MCGAGRPCGIAGVVIEKQVHWYFIIDFESEKTVLNCCLGSSSNMKCMGPHVWFGESLDSHVLSGNAAVLLQSRTRIGDT